MYECHPLMGLLYKCLYWDQSYSLKLCQKKSSFVTSQGFKLVADFVLCVYKRQLECCQLVGVDCALCPKQAALLYETD